jgi:ribosomal protein S18 acetylase RimI-like enzyme
MEPTLDNFLIKSCEELDLRACAEMMASTEPWTIFKYSVDECIKKIKSDQWCKIGLVAEEVAGFISYRSNGVSSSSLVSLLCVSLKFRHRSIGTRLMQDVEQHIFSFDKNLFLFVSDFNCDAIKFYESLHYRQVGIVENYNFEGQAELLFRKTTGPRRQMFHLENPHR